MKLLVLISLLFLIILAGGCVQQTTQTQYVCQDGKTVSSPSDCSTSLQEPTKLNCPTECCGVGGEFKEKKCLENQKCTDGFCKEEPKPFDFEIAYASYSPCSFKYGCSGGICIETDSFEGDSFFNKRGGLDNLTIAYESTAEVPQGNWKIDVDVLNGNNLTEYKNSATFSRFAGTSWPEDKCKNKTCIVPGELGWSEFISAPYTEGGSLKVKITAPNNIAHETTVPMNGNCLTQQVAKAFTQLLQCSEGNKTNGEKCYCESCGTNATCCYNNTKDGIFVENIIRVLPEDATTTQAVVSYLNNNKILDFSLDTYQGNTKFTCNGNSIKVNEATELYMNAKYDSSANPKYSFYCGSK